MIWSNQGESRFSYDATKPARHLGSGSVITDANGNVVETASFDAFGKRRNANSWQGYTNPFSQLPNLAALLNITQKGYIGHIQVDHAAVIHMGGRIYDPELGRFMQAGPIVQDPRDAQSLNRYSYVYNNPLSYTDPTGYECQNQRDKACTSALEQQKEDAAKASQTQGSSKPEDVSQGNQSANLQNAAKVASGSSTQPSFLSGLATNIVEGMGMMLNNPFVDVANAQMDVQRAELEGNPDSVDAAKLALLSTTLPAVVMAATPSPTPGGKPKVEVKSVRKRADFTVTPDGVTIPNDPNILRRGLDNLQDVSTNPSSSRKFLGEDANGPLRVRIEKAHSSDPNFNGTPDPLHTVDHLHIDRRQNVESGPWKSKEKVQYDWPFN